MLNIMESPIEDTLQPDLTNNNQSETGTPVQENKSSNRKFPVWVVVFLICFTGLVVLGGLEIIIFVSNNKISNQTMITEPTMAPVNSKLGAEVTYLSGTAWKVTDGMKIPLSEGDNLINGDDIETDSQSKMVIGFDDGSILRMDENTSIDLPVLTAALMSINDQHGAVYARVKKDPDHKFLVTAGNYKVEATGTAFSVENSDTVEVRVFESSVQISSDSGEQTEVQSAQEWNAAENKAKKMDEKVSSQDEFLAWNKQEDNKLTDINTVPTPVPSIVPTKKIAGIVLTATANSEGVNLIWVLNNIDTPSGVKVLKSTIENPVYPGSEFVYLGDANQKSYRWDVRDGNVWHFRVCRYVDNVCTNYSNDVGIQTVAGSGGSSDSGQVESINLSVSKQDNKAALSWSVSGSSSQGFKITWSKNENPTYPPRDGDEWNYQSNPDTRQFTVENLSGTYHFRVCEYLGGRCGKYSNDVSESF